MSSAAARIRAALDEADAGGYGRTGAAWASYIARDDVEAVLRHVRALEAGLALHERILARVMGRR